MAGLFLIRHGQANFGGNDYDRLSARGVAQAQRLGEWWAHCGQATGPIVAGGMRRHADTARACLAAWRTAPAITDPETFDVDAGLNEFDHQDVLVAARPDLAAPGALQRFLATQADPHRAFQQHFVQAVARWAGGGHDGDYRESWPDFQARCRAALDRLADRADQDRPVFAFTSGGPIGVMVQHVLAVPADRAFDLHWALHNAGVTRLSRRRGRLTLACYNSIAHLEAAGDPALITFR